MPGAKDACVVKVNNLLKVHHNYLVSLYAHYASLGFTSDPEEIDASYTMDTHEFLRLCQDMGVPSKACSLEKLQRLCRDIMARSDMGKGSTILGLAEFKLVLVATGLARITQDAYSDEATRVKVFFDNFVAKADPTTYKGNSFRRLLFSGEVQKVLRDHDAPLRCMFHNYAYEKDETEALVNGKCLTEIGLRDYLFFLQDTGLLEGGAPVEGLQQITMKQAFTIFTSQEFGANWERTP